MSLEALKRNGHNLELGRFELAGEYGVPVLRPVSLPGRLEWIRFNHALRETHRDRYGVHFFIDDYLFQRAWHDPPRYALFLRQFPAVLTPDFSMFTDYPPAVQIYNHWRKHQLGGVLAAGRHDRRSDRRLDRKRQLFLVLRRGAGRRHGRRFLRGDAEESRIQKAVSGRL